MTSDAKNYRLPFQEPLGRGIQILSTGSATFVSASRIPCSPSQWAPAHLRPNLHPPREMFGCLQQHHKFLFLPSPSVTLQEALAQHLKECKCFNVIHSPETNMLGLWAHIILQSSLTAGMKLVIKLSLASTEAKSGQSREQVHLKISPARSSSHQQYMAALQPCLVAVCEAGTSFTLTCFFHIAPLKAEYFYRINERFCRS